MSSYHQPAPAPARPRPRPRPPPINKRNIKWEQRYNELKQYKTIHGNTNVPQSYRENTQLGRWVRRQRLEYGSVINSSTGDSDIDSNANTSELTQYRIQKLMDVDFVFHLKRDVWYQRLEELKEFQSMHGHVRVPQPQSQSQSQLGLSSQNIALGSWVRNQRAMYNRLINENDQNQGDDSSHTYNFLTEERIELLNSVGFCWDVQEENWLEHYEKLVLFHQEHGNVHVPSRYRKDPALSRFVQHQRRNKASLTPERINLLEELDFCWGNRNDLHWWENYEAICRYKEKQGTVSVGSHYHDFKLYNWVNNTRRKCKEYCEFVTKSTFTGEQLLNGDCDSAVSGLNRERIDALRKIDFYCLPCIDSNGDITTTGRPKKEKETSRLKKEGGRRQATTWARTPKLPSPTSTLKKEKEKKAFIPFPWDEI